MRFEIELPDELLAEAIHAEGCWPAGSVFGVMWEQMAAQIPSTFPVTMPTELAQYLAEVGAGGDGWRPNLASNRDQVALRYLAAAARRHLPPRE